MGSAVRGRLSWKSDVSDKLLFTDRSGIKVADPTVHGFAIELRRGTARYSSLWTLLLRLFYSSVSRWVGGGRGR